MLIDARPYVRWWWFSGPIAGEEIDIQLDWIRAHGFGGVEVAWVYPLKGAKKDEGPQFLDDEFQARVRYTIDGCAKRKLGCDLTFGTLWPFSGTFIPKQHQSKTTDGYSTQSVNRSWEARYSKEPAAILDHLDRNALRWYFTYLIEHGFGSFSGIQPLSFFCDSWEVDPDNLGFDGFAEAFREEFGYTYNSESPDKDRRFDYRLCIAERVLDHFYKPYAEYCRQAGAFSRVQCHGAPTDILAAYASVDIPESETLLFDPKFSLFASSAAAMEEKPVVSSESFSCIYGWNPSPDTPPGLKEERIDDLRCVADAQFAWGVNRIIWHGKPYSTPAHPRQFYATVHVGHDGTLEPYYEPFNAYLRALSGILATGETVSNLSILLPLEDQWMLDELPEELQKPSSRYWWELQELEIPLSLMRYRPLWFSGRWVKDLSYREGKLYYKQKMIGALYCMNEWMLFPALRMLVELRQKGAPIIFSRYPKEPGTRKHPEYGEYLLKLQALPELKIEDLRPILASSEPLDFWCRRDRETYYLFLSHPGMRNLRYPLRIGYADTLEPKKIEAVFHTPVHTYPLLLDFPKMGSLLFEIDDLTQTITGHPLHESFA